MIPPAFLLGLMVGAMVLFTKGPRPRLVLLTVSLACSAAWGVGVGISDESIGTAVGGFAFAIANVAAGVVLAIIPAAFVALVLTLLRRRPHQRDTSVA